MPTKAKTLKQYKQDKRKELRKIEPIRTNSYQRGYNRRWRQASKGYLALHPICVKCGNAAQCVDHIKPHCGNMELFWDVSNWQTLCKRCHDVKTAGEDGGFGNNRGNYEKHYG